MILIGMDWLEENKIKLNFYNKTFDLIDEDRNSRKMKGIEKVIFVRNISSL